MVPALATLILLTATGPEASLPGGAPWDGESFRRYEDAAAGLAFVVPLSGFRLEARHFDLKLPVEKVKHLFTLSGPEGVEVTVDVWVDPAKQDVFSFFEKYLAFLRTEETSLVAVVVSQAHLPGILISQPRSGQSFGHRTAVFGAGGRIFRITCLDKDDTRARTVFEHLLQSFEPEVKR